MKCINTINSSYQPFKFVDKQYKLISLIKANVRTKMAEKPNIKEDHRLKEIDKQK